MSLSASTIPTLLAATLQTSALELKQENTESSAAKAEERGTQKCEMKEAKLVLLMPEEKKTRNVGFQPDEPGLCLYYLGRR